jgi:hypothetical protein
VLCHLTIFRAYVRGRGRLVGDGVTQSQCRAARGAASCRRRRRSR